MRLGIKNVKIDKKYWFMTVTCNMGKKSTFWVESLFGGSLFYFPGGNHTFVYRKGGKKMNLVLLGLGLIILVKGADILVGSSSKLAKRFRVPAFIVGLFIVAIGTSAPEAAVGILSGIQGTNLITLGDVVGSSIVNILVILGITSMIKPLKVDSEVPGKEMPIAILVQLVFSVMILTSGTLSRLESVFLLIGMLVFSGYVFVKSRRGEKDGETVTELEEEIYEYTSQQEEVLYEETELNEVKEAPKKEESILRLAILVVIGLAGLILGASMSVNNATAIAKAFGLSEALIGLTVVAFGTSLPELITSLVAVYKKEDDIAVGNILGSNIFNILFVMGISGLLHPITAGKDIIFDLAVMLGASVLLFIPSFFRGKISKLTGLLYLFCYILFLAVKISWIW